MTDTAPELVNVTLNASYTVGLNKEGTVYGIVITLSPRQPYTSNAIQKSDSQIGKTLSLIEIYSAQFARHDAVDRTSA
jgi:hypothetical protein